LQNIISNSSVHLLLAQENRECFGTLTLVVFPIVTGIRAWIEDVVVPESARGKGVGKLLTEKAVALAAMHGAKTVDLTSRPSREAANRLYKSAGFQQRETNVYRFSG
jgi:ribosomal protein S18 acetylase RimI-like enzyme